MADTATRSDPTPLSYQRAAAKEIGLKREPIKPTHIPLRVNPAEVRGRGKEVELLNHHESIQKDLSESSKGILDPTYEQNTCFGIKAGVNALPSSRTNPHLLKTSVCMAPAFT